MRLSQRERTLRKGAALWAILFPLPDELYFEAFVRHYFRLAGWRR